jgi:diguanylate cyclase (GGDEF)-like protein
VEEPEHRAFGPATPFADTTEAITATVEALELLGLGRWEVVDARLDDLTDVEHLLVPILVPDGGLLALRATPTHGRAAISEGGPNAVLYAARMLSTLFAVNKQVEHWRERATKAEAESLTDELTGLLNARAWWRALQREAARCDRYELEAVVAVIDLDELKIVNDTHGHLGGDLLLRSAAQQLTSTLRASDVVARIGGDEFGVLAVDYEGPVPDLLLNRMRASLEANDIRASCGAAVYHPGDVMDNVFKTADANMYVAKSAGRPERSRGTADPSTG